MTETKSNDLCEIIAQAFEQMKERDRDFSSENVNLAELSRITGLSRQRLRRLKRNGFRDVPITRKRVNTSVLEGFTSILDDFFPPVWSIGFLSPDSQRDEPTTQQQIRITTDSTKRKSHY